MTGHSLKLAPTDDRRPGPDLTGPVTFPFEQLGDNIVVDLTVDPPVIALGHDTHPLETRRPPLRARASVRVFDIAGSLALLIALLPIIAVTYLAVRFTSAGPAIYRSQRIGQDGKLFNAFKFRSMSVDADARLQRLLQSDPEARHEYESFHKLRTDPRLTPIGSFIRRTSLDELPQLFNVLSGEMSLVGPRPKLPSEPVRFGLAMQTVLRVKPGLTGLWQVSGRSNLSFDQRIILDVEYALNRTLRTDIAICLKTARQALQPASNGAY